jgi:hypothetical protein
MGCYVSYPAEIVIKRLFFLFGDCDNEPKTNYKRKAFGHVKLAYVYLGPTVEDLKLETQFQKPKVSKTMGVDSRQKDFENYTKEEFHQFLKVYSKALTVEIRCGLLVGLPYHFGKLVVRQNEFRQNTSKV